jgi:hypothetical protein
MGGVYRIERPGGSVEYTDAPVGDGTVRDLNARPGTPERQVASERQPYDHKSTEQMIREAQKRIPKVADYLEYLDYLRHRSPIRFDHVMRELKHEDPQAWLKLQKYPQFRPLHETALGINAATNHMQAGIGMLTGKFTGSVEKWMESTLQSMMRRDRWGPYADVLGRQAQAAAAGRPATYSNSRLGQYLKMDDAQLAQAAKNAAKEAEGAQSGMRAARGAAISRTANPLLDLGFGMLNPETATASAAILMRRRLDNVARRNQAIDVDTPAYEKARTLLSQGRYGELDKFLKEYEQ